MRWFVVKYWNRFLIVSLPKRPRLYRTSWVGTLEPVYTERQRQCSDNDDASDQFGVVTHFWSDMLGVLRNLLAIKTQRYCRHVAGAQCKWAFVMSRFIMPAFLSL